MVLGDHESWKGSQDCSAEARDLRSLTPKSCTCLLHPRGHPPAFLQTRE